MTRSRWFLVLFFLVAPLAMGARSHIVLPPVPAPSGGLIASQPVPVSDRVLAPEWRAQRDPHIAGGASQALVVWQPGRAARIAANGEPIDTTPLELGLAFSPLDVVWDGERYLVAGSDESDTWLLAISTTSAVRTLASVPHTQQVVSLAIAILGDQIAVVRRLGVYDGSMDMLVFARDGQLLRRIDLGDAPFAAQVLRLVPGDDRYLMLAGDHGAIVTRDGAITNIALHASDAAWTGNGWTAVTGGPSLTLARVTPDGAILGATSIRDSEYGSRLPVIAWNGSEYRIAWKEQTAESQGYNYPGYDTMLARVSAANVLLDAQTLATTTDVTGRFAIGLDALDVTTVGGDFLAAWTRNFAPSIETRDVFVALSPSGKPAAEARPQLVTNRLPQQSPLALAVRPGAARVLWMESRDADTPQAHLLTADVRNPSAAEATDLGDTFGAVAAWNGIDTLVVWRDAARRQIVGRRMGKDAQPLVFVTDENAGPVSLACGAHDCALVWSRRLNDGSTIPFLTRIDPSGAVLDAAPLALPNSFIGIAALGDQYLVLWRVFDYVYGATLRDGALSEPRLLASYGFTAVASNGHEWLVAIMRGAAVHTVRVAANGDVAGWEDFTVSAAPAGLPRLAWSGRHWFLAWATPSEIRGARLDGDGKPLDEFSIAATSDNGSLGDIGSAGDGLVAVAYTRSSRAFVTWLTDLR